MGKERRAVWSAAIIAGGRSRRMGFDKQELQRCDRLLTYSLIEWLHPRFNDVIVVTSRPSLYLGQPVTLTRDRLPSRGPLSGIHAALRVCRTPYLYVTACDMPHLSEAWLDRLRRTLDERPEGPGFAACRLEGEARMPEPFHAVYARALLPALSRAVLANRASAVRFLREQKLEMIPYEKDGFAEPSKLFLNLNTPFEAARHDYTRSEG